MANETVGRIDCPFCMGEADVKQNVKGKFYIWCSDDGIIQPTKPNFQEYIKERATMYGEPAAGYQGGGEKAEPEAIPEEKPQAAPTEKPEEKAAAVKDDVDSWMEG